MPSSPALPDQSAVWSWRPATPARIERPVSLLRLEGPDTLRFLHGQSSQDLLQAAPGQWLRTCCLTPTARLLAVAEVLVDASGAWLVITAGDGGAVRAALDRVLFPADDVRLGEVREARLLRPVGPGQAGWDPPRQGEGWLLGQQLVLVGETGLPTWLEGWPPLDAAQSERLRICAGSVMAPGEINGETNPFELGLSPRVSLAKGCYVGQETLARLATYDGVKQQLRRWHCPDPPEDPAATLVPGAILRDGQGQRAGTITSVLRLPPVPTPADGGWIGLALIRRQALEAHQLEAAGQPGLRVSLSLPQDFVAPPVGAAGQPLPPVEEWRPLAAVPPGSSS